jgi:CHAT domain-containing protein/tetratricopeptide (TPR) repeat protein
MEDAMRPVFAPAPAHRLGVALLLLVAAWGLARVGRTEEPARPPRLTAAQQQQLRQAKEQEERFEALWGQGKRGEAIAASAKKLALERQAWGKDHPNLVPSLDILADLQEWVGDFQAARQALQEVLAIRTRQLGKDHWRVADARRALADLRQRAGLTPAERAELREADRLNGRVVHLWRAGRARQVLPLAQKAVAIRGRLLGEEHPEYARSLFNLAAQYEALAQPRPAEALYRRSLQICEKALGKDHPGIVKVLSNLAGLYREQGRYEEAEALAVRGLKIREDTLGKDHDDTGNAMNTLALLYGVQGRFAEAEPLFRRALKIREARLGKDHPRLGTYLNNLAALCLYQGRFAEAEPLWRRALKIQEEHLDRDDPRLATSLSNLGSLYLDQGRYPEAEPLFRRALKIREARLPPNHPHVAQSLNNLAALHRAQGHYAEAAPLILRAVKCYEAQGGNHPDTSHALNNLAWLYRQQGRPAEAEPLYRRALAVAQARGKDHPDVAICLGNLALLSEEQGHYQEAERLHRRSLKICRDRLGPVHPHVATCLQNLAWLYEEQGRHADAVTYFDRALRGQAAYLRLVLPALAAGEQLAFLEANVKFPLAVALALAVARRGDAGVADRSAGWRVNTRALTREALAGPLLLARAAAAPRLRPLLGRLIAVRRQLATRLLAVPLPGQESQRLEQLAALEGRERELTKELGRRSSLLPADRPWVELDQVRKALPADAVFIDVARLDASPARARGKEGAGPAARYAAWVIPPAGRGDVRIVDLGEAAQIEAAVGAAHQALKDVPRSTRGGEAEAERRLQERLRALSRLVLEPLAKPVGRARHWLVSPDGALWLVPWAALPLQGGRYAVEQYQISYLVSGRDLVAAPAPAAPGRALILADPDFDHAPEAPAREEESGPVVRGPRPAGPLPRFARLPGTAAEAKAVAPLLQRYTGARPLVRTGTRAEEGLLKNTRGPRVLLLSTHGYFLEDQNQGRLPAIASRGLKLTGLDLPPPSTGGRGQVLENPLLRCGLALAGANRRARIDADGEDGILTGLEVVGLDLRGTELVVLSACETGLGKVNVGEGVAGLRQAFQLAGAQAVVATLWQIPDRETTALMTAFFTHLANQKGKAEALRRAQLDVIKQRRAKGKAAHPFYWAAFTLTGQWR